MVRISTLFLGSLVGCSLAASPPAEDASKAALSRRLVPGTGAGLLHGLPSAFRSFGGLLNQIQACQTALVPGMSMQAAMAQLTQITTQFQSAFNPLLTCGTCDLGGTGINAFGGVLQEAFIRIQGIFSQVQTLFGGQWTGLMSNAFEGFGGIFPRMFNLCNQIGLPLNNFLGGGVVQSFSSLKVTSIQHSFSRFGLV